MWVQFGYSISFFASLIKYCLKECKKETHFIFRKCKDSPLNANQADCSWSESQDLFFSICSNEIAAVEQIFEWLKNAESKIWVFNQF